MPVRAPDLIPFEYGFAIPHDARAVGIARNALRTTLAAYNLHDLIDRAQLLASEMLTNAYAHSEGEAQLRWKWRPDTLRMTVCDTSPEPPDQREAREDSESGRGLHLLSVIADQWAHYLLPARLDGSVTKVVWCEIGRKPRPEW
jgi:anti-sigma regulatory factor (Ser/Thr protein kinase)